ncbi:unnamed protein product [Musa hybrid cultivar]
MPVHFTRRRRGRRWRWLRPGEGNGGGGEGGNPQRLLSPLRDLSRGSVSSAALVLSSLPFPHCRILIDLSSEFFRRNSQEGRCGGSETHSFMHPQPRFSVHRLIIYRTLYSRVLEDF